MLLEHEAADIWQPDMNWCGGLTELRRIAALAAAQDIPVIPHGGWRGGAPHFASLSSSIVLASVAICVASFSAFLCNIASSTQAYSLGSRGEQFNLLTCLCLTQH